MGSLIAHYGYLAVAALVLLESFGIPVPGETAIIAGGVAAGSGDLHVSVVAVVAGLAAVVGDNIGYLIGRAVPRTALLRAGRLVRLSEARLDKLERFMARRGAPVIVVARFIEGLRQLNGIIAGLTRVPWYRFLIYNMIGAAAWVAVWTAAGFYAGGHLSAILSALSRYEGYAIGAGVLAVLVWLALHLRRRRRRQASSSPSAASKTS